MNKRVASRRPKTIQSIAQEIRPARLKQMRTRSQDLQQEIHKLECAIAAAPATIRRRRLASRDILPAPEPMFGSKKSLRSPQRIPLHQRKAAHRRRLALYLELGLVFATLTAALGWMNQWFQWW